MNNDEHSNNHHCDNDEHSNNHHCNNDEHSNNHHCDNCETFFGDTNTVVSVKVAFDRYHFCSESCMHEYFRVFITEYY